MNPESPIMEGRLRILVVGLGMIGASYAQRFKELGLFTGGISARVSTIQYALDHGIIDEGSTEVSPEFVSTFDVVVSGLYPKVFIDWVRQYQSYFKSGAILTDVTGVKSSVLYTIQDFLREDVELIGAHPMAGREVSGIENGNPAVFRGANYIITPTEKNTPKGMAVAMEIGRLLEFRHISVLSPEEHDSMIAFLSQLTHCIAVSLMCCKDDSRELVRYTGDSFRDLTRIANINGNMWSELFLMNKERLLEQMDLFAEQFARMRDSIAQDDAETLKEMMRVSTERRAWFNK